MNPTSRLPAPVSDNWQWQHEGSCLHADAHLFFHPEGEHGPARQRRDAAAIAVCASCPVILECRRHALTVREPYGVWGGLTTEDRRGMLGTERIPEPGCGRRPAESSAPLDPGEVGTPAGI